MFKQRRAQAPHAGRAEIDVACSFLTQLLAAALGKTRADAVGSRLTQMLSERFEAHWFPSEPTKGSGYRCVSCTPGKLDPVIIKTFTATCDAR